MKRNILTTLFAFVAGIVGFFFRTRQLASSYDSSGFHETPDIWGVLLIILCVLAAAVIVAAALLKRSDYTPEYKGNALYVALSCLGAAALAGYCVFSLLKLGTTQDRLANFAFPVFGLVSVFCTVVFAFGLYKSSPPNRLGAAGALPIFFCCMWIILCYRENSIEPTVSLYMWELFAIVLAAASFCVVDHCAIYRVSNPFALILPAATLFTVIITLADSRSGGEVLLFIYLGIEMACSALMAPGCKKRKNLYRR